MTGPVVIYTDGACKGNPGPGGWGAVLQYRGREREIFGGEAATTNNRMELTAVIRALESLKRKVPPGTGSAATPTPKAITAPMRSRIAGSTQCAASWDRSAVARRQAKRTSGHRIPTQRNPWGSRSLPSACRRATAASAGSPSACRRDAAAAAERAQSGYATAASPSSRCGKPACS
jgi:hypothetical protein